MEKVFVFLIPDIETYKSAEKPKNSSNTCIHNGFLIYLAGAHARTKIMFIAIANTLVYYMCTISCVCAHVSV